MIALAAKAFGGASLLTKGGIILAMLVSLGIAYGVWHHHVWENGYDDALKDIAKQDNRAITKARDYRSRVVECRDRGLRWSQSTGQCVRR